MTGKEDRKWITICVPDNCGRLVGKRQPSSRLAEATARGMAMPNFHLVTGLDNRPQSGLSASGAHTGFRNGYLRADLATRFMVPGDETSAYYLADALDENGAQVEQAPRAMLRRQLAEMERLGLAATMASELEFYLFDQSYAEIAAADYRDFRPFHHRHGDNDPFVTGSVRGFLDRLADDLLAAGIVVDQVQGEGGVGQLEVNVRPAEPLAACDRHAIFKHVAKSRAMLEGRALTFMAKPFEDDAGSGGHVHLCLTDAAGDPLLTENAPPEGAAEAFIAGILAYSADFMLLHAPYQNSYRRLRPGSFTPMNASFAWDNRTALVRLTGGGRSARFEFRLPGADANPYHVYAGLIAAGLAGVRARLTLGPPVRGDAALASPRTLPQDLTEAFHAFRRSAVAREALGETAHAHLLELAAAELDILRTHVTDWDRRRGFEAG